MVKQLTIAVLAMAALACANEGGTHSINDTTTVDNKTKPEEKKEEWISLLDEKGAVGWHKYGGGPIDSVWQVKNGELFLSTAHKKETGAKGDWDIVTNDEYGNFELELEWKISQNGNSGIIFYIHEDKAKYRWPWQTGMEMQVLDNEGHPDAKYPKHRAGDLYDLIACSKETVKPYGEWNKVKIRSLNGKLDMYLNGTNVVSTTLWDDNWKSLVAGSKFKNAADFGTYKKGRIGLQDHGNDVWYRNIKIKNL